jgi:type IV pilus assembly protein PilV
MLSHQRGSFLLEALISVLLFTGGLLALMGLASVSMNQVAQTKYRNDASNLASELAGLMYTNWDGTTTSCTGIAFCTDWVARVGQQLPNGVGLVTINNNQVDITITWTDSQSAAGSNTHTYLTSAIINR